MFFAIAGFIGDVAVFILSCYTLFITAISRKIKFLTFGISSSLFYGTDISVTVMNKSLHPIPVQSFFIMKRYGGKYYLMGSEKREPIIIDCWGIRQLDLGAFTSSDWPIMDEDNKYPDYAAVFEDTVIGIISEKERSPIWIKTYKKAPLKEARKAYKKHKYEEVSTYRYCMTDGKVCSELVDCHIQILQKDINGQIQLRDVYGISNFNDGKDIYLNKPILGRSTFRSVGHSAKKISKHLQKTLKIKKENIYVEMIDEDPFNR